MSLLSKGYDPASIEPFWRELWSSRGYFRMGDDPSRVGQFCILLPPPNVTGTLHMGHGFNQTLMDALIRYHYLCGDNVLWQPGTDHAGIATQMVVERQLNQQGQTRQDLGRARFVDAVWSWKQKSGDVIMQQMRRLGVACDWSRTCFTLDDDLSENVTAVFVRLYRDGLIYRGQRMIHWDPKLKTAVSDLEVSNTPEAGWLWFISYRSGSAALTVATTRPETLFGDTAIAVHPDDERYRAWIGQFVQVPLGDRLIPVIADESVDPSFGTGCVKVTPAHDFDDYARGIKYNLDFIEIFDEEARLNSAAPEPYCGLDRDAARQLLLLDLEKQGLLVQKQPHQLTRPRGDRSGVVLEPRVTDQWFVDLTRDVQADGRPGGRTRLTEPALRLAQQKDIHVVPEGWYNTYQQWLLHIQDWCISRQLWWGHQVPAWFSDDRQRFWVAHHAEEAALLAQRDGYHGPLIQDEDVLDTWFSSALWPFSSLGWTKDYPAVRHPAMDRYLPSSVLVTGFDIIFFWVARMVMLTHYCTGQIPFRTVYVHGLIRDSEGQKMSKSRGNVLDPIDLVDGISLEDLVQKRTSGLMNPAQAQAIEERTRREFPQGIAASGTDALRFTFLSLAAPGRDIKFDLDRCAGYRNFCNKLWNATRFVLMNCADRPVRCSSDHASWADCWILSRLNTAVDLVHKAFSQFRFDWAAQEIHSFFWDAYCDWYIEMAKIQLASGQPEVVGHTAYVLCLVLDVGLRLAHPLIPFITEELWQKLRPYLDTKPQASILEMRCYPRTDPSCVDQRAEEHMVLFKKLVISIRQLRVASKLSPAQKVPLIVKREGDWPYDSRYLLPLSQLSAISFSSSLDDRAPKAVVLGGTVMLDVPFDRVEEKARLAKEKARLHKECAALRAVLDQPGFCEKAPQALVEKKRAQLLEKEKQVSLIDDQIRALE